VLIATSTLLREVAAMPSRQTASRTNTLLLTLILVVLGAGGGVLGIGCSQSFTPLYPEEEPIPVFASSPRDLISEVLVDLLPDSIWVLEEGGEGARFRIPEKSILDWTNRSIDLVVHYYPKGQTELRILDGPDGNVVLNWDFYTIFGYPAEGEWGYYPLPTSISPDSLIHDHTVWVKTKLVKTEVLHLRIVEKAVPYDVIQLPANTVRASLIHSSSGIGLLAVLYDGQLVELDANGSPLHTWNSSWPNREWECWLSATFVDGQLLFLRTPFLYRIGPEDWYPDTLGELPGCVGIASAGDRLYTIIKGDPDENATLLSYDLAAVLAGSDIQSARLDSVALSFNISWYLFETADGALLTFHNRFYNLLTYFFPSGVVAGEWVIPFYDGYMQSAYYDGTGLYLVPRMLEYSVVLADWGEYHIPPVLFRFPVTIDP
jgi:hypothetical protein